MDVSEEDEDHEDHEDLEEDRLPDLIREDEGPEPRECWVGFILEKFTFLFGIFNHQLGTQKNFDHSVFRCSTE